MRFRDLRSSVHLLYRLCIAGEMLRVIRVFGRGNAHNYTKMMLSYLLIVEHWRKTNYVGLQMMKDNMQVVNEELGECTFSMLGRVVLGHTIKSDFEHMCKMYSLLPLYRDVVSEFELEDQKPDQINWHHEVKEGDECIAGSALCLRGVIRDILSGHYQSYNGEPQGYKNQRSARNNLSNSYTPLVFQPEVINSFADLFLAIGNTMNQSNILQDYPHLWPESKDAYELDVKDGDSSDNANDLDDMNIDQEYGYSWRECSVGKMAIACGKFPPDDQLGIVVYEVTDINDDTVDDDGKPEHSFMGFEYVCSISNISYQCVRGSWTKRGNTRKQLVKHWEIITYFNSLNMDNHLPAPVQQTIESHAENIRIFHIQAP